MKCEGKCEVFSLFYGCYTFNVTKWTEDGQQLMRLFYTTSFSDDHRHHITLIQFSHLLCFAFFLIQFVWIVHLMLFWVRVIRCGVRDAIVKSNQHSALVRTGSSWKITAARCWFRCEVSKQPSYGFIFRARLFALIIFDGMVQGHWNSSNTDNKSEIINTMSP